MSSASHQPPTSLANTTTLSNGVVMPLVGFGCAGKLNHVPIAHAIRAGYRLFDTSQATEWYLEESLGEALRHSGVPLPREEVFLTTKLHPRDLGEQSTLDAFPNSLKNLHTAYIDAFLLHYPRCFGNLCPPNGGQPAGTWRDSWRALETLYHRGLVKAIGVSNFSPDEFDELISVAKVKPHLVQSWMDPLMQARPLRERCKTHGVLFQAYSTLGTQWAGRGIRYNPVLKHPVILRIAKELGRSTAQVALRWALQSGVAIIPRSQKPKNMANNLMVFDFALDSTQMAAIDALDGTDPNTISLPPPPPRLCEDENKESCGMWADAGECESNPGYMHKACAASCDKCEELLAAKHEL